MMTTEEGEQTGAPDDKMQDAWDEAWRSTPVPEEAEASFETRLADLPDALEAPAPKETTECTSRGAPPLPSLDARLPDQEPDLGLETLPVPPAAVRRDTDAPPPATASKDIPPVASGGAEERSPQRPLSMAETWAAAQSKPKLPLRLIAAGVVTLTALAASTWLWGLGDALHVPSLAPPSLEAVIAGVPAAQQRDAWLKDVLAAKRQVPQSWDPALPVSALPSAPRETRRPVAQAPTLARSGRARGAPPPAVAPQTVAPEPDDFYGSIFGSAERYRTASGKPSSHGDAKPESLDQAPNVEGVVIRVRLQDEAASDPTGAPVIATLVRKAKVGTTVLYPGTELHGRVTGGNDTRVFVDFQFARTSEGNRLELQASARDQSGRAGIPGKKMFTQRTAGSIGVASASKAVQAAGREFAGVLGSVLGAGLEGATDAGADKAKRADRDEYVVLAPRGASFAVYVQSIGRADRS